MTEPCRSSVPDFPLGDVIWQCWIIDGAYEWRSTCGRFAAWGETVETGCTDGSRPAWRKVYHARRDGRDGPLTHPTLTTAMWSAMTIPRREAA